MKDLVAVFRQNHLSPPGFVFTAMQMDDSTYELAQPFGDWSDLDQAAHDFAELPQIVKDRIAQVNRDGGPATEYWWQWTFTELPELSYHPEAVSASGASAQPYFRDHFYYVWPGHEDEAIAIVKEWLALFKSKKVPPGYTIYRPEIGPDLPLLVIRRSAKDAADMELQLQTESKLFAGAEKDLLQRTYAIARKLEIKNGWLREDLSYQPEMAPEIKIKEMGWLTA